VDNHITSRAGRPTGLPTGRAVPTHGGREIAVVGEQTSHRSFVVGTVIDLRYSPHARARNT